MDTIKESEKHKKLPLHHTRKADFVAADVEQTLIDFTSERRGKSIKELKGKISFREGYDYKALRSRV